jgi:hypothetical protein
LIVPAPPLCACERVLEQEIDHRCIAMAWVTVRSCSTQASGGRELFWVTVRLLEALSPWNRASIDKTPRRCYIRELEASPASRPARQNTGITSAAEKSPGAIHRSKRTFSSGPSTYSTATAARTTRRQKRVVTHRHSPRTVPVHAGEA